MQTEIPGSSPTSCREAGSLGLCWPGQGWEIPKGTQTIIELCASAFFTSQMNLFCNSCCGKWMTGVLNVGEDATTEGVLGLDMDSLDTKMASPHQISFTSWVIFWGCFPYVAVWPIWVFTCSICDSPEKVHIGSCSCSSEPSPITSGEPHDQPSKQ